MKDETENPFRVTRAADFTDEQIHQYWVDLADDSSFSDIVKPTSEMPMVILGGKGSGKTHIMRYLSFPLQRIRHASDVCAGLSSEQYIGVYMRCSGLNSARFRNKGQTEDVWSNVFAYYMELWLAQLLVESVYDACASWDGFQDAEQLLASDIHDLFDVRDDTFPSTVATLVEYLRTLRRELDVAINNSVIDRTLDVTLRVTPGRLIFGIPSIIVERLTSLSACRVLYLIDEFENLTEPQQRFINSLMRERYGPSSFKVGVKLYGIRTNATLCADEENKEGSEYERLPLDDRLRQNETRYSTFSRRLVCKRLLNSQLIAQLPDTDDGVAELLSKAFLEVRNQGLAEQETAFVLEKYAGRERPYLKSLRQKLESGVKSGFATGIESDVQISQIIERMSCREYPLVEKVNTFLFYQSWSAKENLLQASEQIRNECAAFLQDRNVAGRHHDKLRHFKYDLLAQLRRECDRKQQYAGFDTFVNLSWGNPRHLLIILKHVFSWALFKGERPFSGNPISVEAQTAGVKEASEWFFRDARMTGEEGKQLQDSIQRLGTLFRSIRFADKPSECSLCTFSYDPTAASPNSRRIINSAEQWSLLVEVGSQRDRNSERVDAKLQINRLLSPMWDIPFFSRGALALQPEEVNAIFDPDFSSRFEELLGIRVGRMTAPAFGARGVKELRTEDKQTRLPGILDD